MQSSRELLLVGRRYSTQNWQRCQKISKTGRVAIHASPRGESEVNFSFRATATAMDSIATGNVVVLSRQHDVAVTDS